MLSAITTNMVVSDGQERSPTIPTCQNHVFGLLRAISLNCYAENEPPRGRQWPTFTANVWYAGSDPSSESRRALDLVRTQWWHGGDAFEHIQGSQYDR